MLKANLEEGPPRGSDLLRGERQCFGLARRGGAPDRKRTQLHMDVAMRRRGDHRLAPFGKDLRRPPGVGTAQDRAAEVVQDDRRLGKISRPVPLYLTLLGMVTPGIESESEPG